MASRNPAPVRNAPPLMFSQVAQDYVAAVGTIPYDGGTRNPNPLQLIPDGYLDRLAMVMTLSGQYGTAGPSAVDPEAVFSGPVERIEMVGTQNRGLYNLSGEFAGIFTFLDRWYRSPVGSSSMVSAPGFNGVALPGTAAFTGVWYYDLPLGVKINEFDAPIGLYPVGFTGPAPRINVYFRPVNATAANPGTGVYVPGGGATGPAPTGSFDVSQRGFAPVAVDTAQPPGNLVRTFREGSVTINGNQQYVLEVQQGAFAVRVAIMVIANGVLANVSSIQSIEYDFGFGMRRKVWNTLQLQNMITGMWGSNLPSWLTVLDMYTATHSMRDWINTTAVTRPRIYITLQGLSYGGAQNQIRFGIEEIFPYATAVAQSVR
jgi:hypothetical protein